MSPNYLVLPRASYQKAYIVNVENQVYIVGLLQQRKEYVFDSKWLHDYPCG